MNEPNIFILLKLLPRQIDEEAICQRALNMANDVTFTIRFQITSYRNKTFEQLDRMFDK